MARTSEELLDQLDRMLPDYFRTLDPRVAIPATLADSEERAEALQPLATIHAATGKWLTLQARGYGIQRATGESNASLRKRMRHVDDALTRPAIKAAVDDIISPDECTIVEWYDAPYLGIEDASGAWLGNQLCILSMGPNSFAVIIPDQGGGFELGGFLGSDAWLGIEYIAATAEPPEYSAIVNEVTRLRAAGVFWRLVLET